MSRKNAPNAASEEEEEEEEEEEVGDDVEEEVRFGRRRRRRDAKEEEEGTTKRGGNAVERWSWVQGGWFVCVNSMVLGLVDTWQPRGSKSEANARRRSVGSRAEERSRVGSGARGVLFSFTRVDALGEWFTDEE